MVGVVALANESPLRVAAARVRLKAITAKASQALLAAKHLMANVPGLNF